MRFVILGATGGTGLQLIRRALTNGHAVTAFVRSTEPLREFEGCIDIRKGDLLDKDTLADALRGHDAVLSAFGPRIPIAQSDIHLLEQFAGVLTGAMANAEVQRLVIISTAFLFKDSIVPPAYLLGRMLFPTVVSDTVACERIVRQSQLDWTIVRPPQLTDKPFRGSYRVRFGHLPRFGFKISRADVADYFIRSAPDRSLSSKIVGISN